MKSLKHSPLFCGYGVMAVFKWGKESLSSLYFLRKKEKKEYLDLGG